MTQFDETIDAAFEPLRGKPRVDRVAALVSNLADYGLIWVILALLKARRRGPDRRRAEILERSTRSMSWESSWSSPPSGKAVAAAHCGVG